MLSAQLSANDGLSIESKIDNAFFTIGDRVVYELTVRHPANMQLVNLDTNETLRDFEIKEEKSFREKEKEVVTEGKRVIITSFQLGEYVLPPAKISYQDAKGEKKELLSNKLFVSVESVDKSTNENKDIRGVKGVAAYMSGRMKWFLWSIVLFAIGSFSVWFFLRRRSAKTSSTIRIPLLPPSDEAYQALHELFESDLLKRGQCKAYFSRISEIIRRYLERRLALTALESTTTEVLKAFYSLPLDASTQELLKTILETCDFVKFAKYKPIPNEILKLNQKSREVVEHIEAAYAPAAQSNSS